MARMSIPLLQIKAVSLIHGFGLHSTIQFLGLFLSESLPVYKCEKTNNAEMSQNF